MSYRDDHDAALARMASLEQELAVARADDSEQAEKIRALEHALGDARAQRDRAERELARLRPPEPPTTVVERDRRAGPGLWLAILVLPVLIIGIAVAVRRDRSTKAMVAPAPAQPVMAATVDDTSRLIDEAMARAGTKLAGGYLSSIDIRGIDETGKIHPEYDGSIRLKFYRSHPVAPPPERPIGAPAPTRVDDGFECLLLMKTKDSADWGELDDEMLCKDMQIYLSHSESKPPVCTPTAIWRLARQDGAPAGAIASLDYRGTWHFQIQDSRAPFDRTYDDNCTR